MTFSLESAHPMSRIARMTFDASDDRANEPSPEPTQLVTLDYFQHDGRFEDYARFSQNGVWLRYPEPHPAGTRVVLHLVLPLLFAPINIRGTVAGQRRHPEGGAPWMLVWFDADKGEDALLLQRFLREHLSN